MTLLTTTQAAEQLGIKPDSVRKLVARKILAAEKYGTSLMFTAAAVDRAKGRRGVGRPATRRATRRLTK
jgi:excisionase family DNA binding protein